MDDFKGYLRAYWKECLAIVLFLVVAGQYVASAQWLGDLPVLVGGFVGLMMFLESETISEILAESSYTRYSGGNSPILMRVSGGVCLIAVNVYLVMR